MSNETKRNVFEVALNHATKTGWVDYGQLLDRYNAALPDDMPVIPKAVSDYISKAKKPRQWGLLDVFWHLGDNISAMGVNGLYDWQRWIIANQNTFATAWVLGVWSVEETGEIVKLEAEK